MVTIRTLESYLNGIAVDLARLGYGPVRIVLFGSYAKGTPHQDSDIDIAVWAAGFTGARTLDITRIAPILRNYPDVELHPFAATDEVLPFEAEILRTGIDYSYFIPRQTV